MIPSPLKQDQIVHRLRQQILSGELKPGAQLETRVVLEEQLQVSTVTIQKALDQLVAEGFIVTHGRRGTFVTDHPPHIYRYALAFEDHPNADGQPWNRFYEAILREAIAINQGAGPHKFQIYYDIQGREDIEDYRRLAADLQNRRLAGVIFVTLSTELAQSDLLSIPNVGRVNLGPVGGPEAMRIAPNHHAFITRALDHLKSIGRTRIAHIGAGITPDFADAFAFEVAARGMTTHPYWSQGPSHHTPAAIRNVLHLLMNPNQSERPDGLILSDDHIVEHALMGLAAAGARMPQDVSVVAHCNFPFPPISGTPVKLLGFDVRQFLTLGMEMITQFNKGERPANITLVPPVFEEESPRRASIFR